MNEIKKCKVCGEELPLSAFLRARNGSHTATCKSCRESAKQSTLRTKRSLMGGKLPPFFDPDFDGKSLREVMDMMSRAKRWLESRGCVINLSGEYHETKIKRLKFE